MQWRPVVGYEGLYEVSSAGFVRRVGAATGAKVGRILKFRPMPGWWPCPRTRSCTATRLRSDGPHKNPMRGPELGPRGSFCAAWWPI